MFCSRFWMGYNLYFHLIIALNKSYIPAIIIVTNHSVDPSEMIEKLSTVSHKKLNNLKDYNKLKVINCYPKEQNMRRKVFRRI
uniref:Putative secreted protein n=1 Tax=Panstrongylus lignarius TaxID=156445 RepID=A0A224XSH4_9HEMI